MKLITEAEADKTKHVFAGMWRPPWAEILESCKGAGVFINETTRETYTTYREIREAWCRGDFDIATYKEPQDAIQQDRRAP